jgi:acetyl esterase
MIRALTSRLSRLWQAVKVWGFRRYYRFSSAWAWRRHGRHGPFTDLQIPLGATRIKARLYPNALGATKPLIVYMHGGGWVIGDLESHHPFCQALTAATGCTVIALDYRLAPEHRFPAAQDDCLQATRWIGEHARELGPNGGKLLIAGDSAGGNLAACACLEAEPAIRAGIVGQVLIYPVTDYYTAGFASYVEKATGQMLTASLMHWFWDSYLGKLSAQAEAAQRAFPLRSSGLASLPPTLLVTAENDPLRDEGKAYAEQLRQAGVAVTTHHFASAEHGFACSQGPGPDFQAFMTQLTAWLDQLD